MLERKTGRSVTRSQAADTAINSGIAADMGTHESAGTFPIGLIVGIATVCGRLNVNQPSFRGLPGIGVKVYWTDPDGTSHATIAHGITVDQAEQALDGLEL